MEQTTHTSASFPHETRRLINMGLTFIIGKPIVGIRFFLMSLMAAHLGLLPLAAMGLAMPFFLVVTCFIAGIMSAPINELARYSSKEQWSIWQHHQQQCSSSVKPGYFLKAPFFSTK